MHQNSYFCIEQASKKQMGDIVTDSFLDNITHEKTKRRRTSLCGTSS